MGDTAPIRKILAFINAAGSFDEPAVPPNYGLRELVGDKTGRWAMTVTKNWRLTFIKIDEATIADLDWRTITDGYDHASLAGGSSRRLA